MKRHRLNVHNDFFKNLTASRAKSSERSAEIGESEESSPVLERSESNQNISEENDETKCVRDEIRELKHVAYGLQRQLARIETLIKFQKEPAVDSDDIHSRKESYIEILQSYGLPIASKEKLDEIEQNLKAAEFKTKLVCHDYCTQR